MDFGKDLKKYIKPSAKVYIYALIWLVISTTLLFGFDYLDSYYDAKEPIKFKRNTKENTYGYIDVQYLSKWLYKEGNAYTVIIDEEDIGKYKDMIDYTYNKDENAVAPPTIRMKGNVEQLDEVKAENISDTFDYKNADEYYRAMGKMILNSKTTPLSLLSIFCLLSLIVTVPFFIKSVKEIITQSKCFLKSINKLNDKNEYDKACDELNQEDRYIFNEHGVILTQHFIFVKNKGIAINFNNLLWCYKRTQSYNGVVVDRCIIMYTLSQGKLRLAFKRKYEFFIAQILDIISDKNSEAICGFTKENKHEYKHKKKEIQHNR